MLSAKSDVLQYYRKRKGYERKELAPSHSSKSRFIQGGFFKSSNPYCRAQKEEYSGTECMGSGALLQS